MNRWTSYESPNATDWLEVDFGREREVGRVEGVGERFRRFREKFEWGGRGPKGPGGDGRGDPGHAGPRAAGVRRRARVVLCKCRDR